MSSDGGDVTTDSGGGHGCPEEPQSGASEQQSLTTSQRNLMQSQEELQRKFPGRPPGTSAFLQRRLAKGQKYFDSGDYQMAKQKSRLPTSLLAQPTGEAIPTPECVPHPHRKSSLVQLSKKQVVVDP